MHSPIPLTREVVLVGGGHAHALLLRKWAMKPLAGARLTLINPDPAAPYTGMLPGFVAGHYPRDALMIDLVRLARVAGARLILGRATNLDTQSKTITVLGRPDIRFDIASLDIGITSDLPSLPGFENHAVPAKPLGQFADRWEALVAAPPPAPKIVVLGGGVGGVELALAAKHRLGSQASVSVVEAGPEVLPVLPPRTRAYMLDAVASHEIELHTGARATCVTAEAVALDTGAELAADLVVGATGARPQDWLRDTGLALQNGFVEVDTWLRSISDPSVFAVGDCAHLSFAPRPKAGVYAVRQAPVLFHNIRADLTGSQRKIYKAQGDYLKLISTGRKTAVLDRSGLALRGDWAWTIKDRIDRAFMEKFERLPTMAEPELPRLRAGGVEAEVKEKAPLCGGCGAKVGIGTLSRVLPAADNATRKDLVSAIGDDAAILQMGDTQQVITTDHLRAFVEDPYLMTRIALQHALGDIWAMGATPQIALSQVILPQATPPIHEGMLAEITAAAQAGLAEIGAELAGGHTSIGAELTIGFTVTGLAEPKAVDLSGASPGDKIVLTRPIGTGVLLAAEMQARAKGPEIAALWNALSLSQSKVARDLAGVANAMTDVTGFGLAGHLSRLCTESGVGAELRLADIPIWPGALAASEAGIASSLYPENRAFVQELPDDTALLRLLFDPQTAGGLLAAVPEDTSIPNTWTIGRIIEQPGLRLSV
ncbi:MAG: selenide, water dikinase SelD [Dinoroseobacter sp.]|nr:selenide, water dikinase SelD [Dinoroseobacter sp.]